MSFFKIHIYHSINLIIQKQEEFTNLCQARHISNVQPLARGHLQRTYTDVACIIAHFIHIGIIQASYFMSDITNLLCALQSV